MILMGSFLAILLKSKNKFHPLERMTAHPLVILPTVDSTNNHAMRELRSGHAQDGMVFFALEQTNGRGQRGKKWTSNKGENIMMSMIWDANGMHITQQFMLSCSVALACFDFFNNHAQDQTSIKWPNDIYWCDRKAGGILIDNVIKGPIWEYAVIGMGININQSEFSALANKAVSLKQITGKSWDVIALAKELLEIVSNRLEQIRSGNSEQILHEYNDCLYKKGVITKFKKNEKCFEGLVNGVNENGELIVTCNEQQYYSFGEIEWLL